MSASAPWRRRPGGIDLDVRLTPKAARDGIDGVAQDSAGFPYIAARVRAAPAGGKANAALVKLIARLAGVPASAATVVRGAKARRKTVRVAGDAEALISAIRAGLSAGS